MIREGPVLTSQMVDDGNEVKTGQTPRYACNCALCPLWSEDIYLMKNKDDFSSPPTLLASSVVSRGKKKEGNVSHLGTDSSPRGQSVFRCLSYFLTFLPYPPYTFPAEHSDSPSVRLLLHHSQGETRLFLGKCCFLALKAGNHKHWFSGIFAPYRNKLLCQIHYV